MRKLLLVAVLALGACASEDKGEPRLAEPVDTTAPRENTTTDKDKSEETTTTTAAQRAVFAIGDRVETGRGNFITLHAYEQPSPPAEFTGPDPGHEFAAADVEYCVGPNPTESSPSIGPGDFELQMGDNTRREFDLSLSREPSLNYTDVGGPGDCLRGWVTFQVPVGIRPAFLVLLNTDPLIKFAL